MKRKDALLDEVLLTGQMMSNVCFNYGQESGPSLLDIDRDNLAALARRWDAARFALRRKPVSPPKRKGR